jgi:hypothetical protein
MQIGQDDRTRIVDAGEGNRQRISYETMHAIACDDIVGSLLRAVRQRDGDAGIVLRDFSNRGGPADLRAEL